MPKVAPSPVDRLARAVAVVEDALLVLILAAMVAVAAAQIVLRNLFDAALLWADPALRVMVLWVGMIGAMVATRFDKQISVDVMSRVLPVRWRAGVRVATDVFTAGIAAFVAWHAGRLVLDDRAAGAEVFSGVPVWACEAVIPIALAVIGLRYLLMAARHGRQALAGEDVT